jgi:hypothetical protein
VYFDCRFCLEDCGKIDSTGQARGVVQRVQEFQAAANNVKELHAVSR